MTCRFVQRVAREEEGAFLMELLVSAFLVVLLTVGSMAAFDYASQQSGAQRSRAQAANIAQSEIERLRSLKFSQLQGMDATTTKVVDGKRYSITSRGETAFNPQAAGGGCDDTTKSAEALAAVHAFLRFQVIEHRTANTGNVEEDRPAK